MFNLFEKIKKALPPISQTEYDALMAGTTWFDGELFSGKPNWNILNNIPKWDLSEKERAFLNGPVQTLCEMIDDYDINHDRADLSEEIWNFIKENKFFGMIIPEEYGGLGFSAKGHSEVVMKIASRSIAVAVTVMVPNSLGPAELLLQYGTYNERQKYLPNLADGKEIPCFALTSPYAGSDAASIPDVGYIGRGKWNGETIIGVYLHFDKRYITLAPVATVMGLAVKLEDPFKLSNYPIKQNEITVFLLPTNLPGIEIGNRHNPLETHFLNGPIRGKDIFVPLDMILGGTENIGKGWRMLMECLSVGRCISLPSLSCGNGKKATKYVSAYARIRKQFKLPIGKFGGVQEVLARIAGLTFIMECTRKVTLNAVDQGAKPSVISAICKYHLTEMGRQVVNDAMDVMGGTGICLGPKNLFGKTYQSIPISITVEGANILTRNMMIFGQGSIRNHPFIFEIMEAVAQDEKDEFNTLVKQHFKYTFGNIFRGLFYNLIGFLIPEQNVYGPKHLNRFSATFAIITDITMMVLKGSLKREERISARLGDILSYMYLLSCVHYFCDNTVTYKWAENYLLYNIQETFYNLLQNYPNKKIGWLLLKFAFPYGRTFKAPNDKAEKELAEEMLKYRSKSRNDLTTNVFISENENDQTYKLDREHDNIEVYDSFEKIVLKIRGDSFNQKVDNAAEAGLIPLNSVDFIKQTYHRLRDVVQVDEFESI